MHMYLPYFHIYIYTYIYIYIKKYIYINIFLYDNLCHNLSSSVLLMTKFLACFMKLFFSLICSE